ncbi:hypothetical protein BASA50_009654 [Batrachochytrium salamandrivorans]|uniref:MYND-type domain-containing protein n=1 Tax=Batrachochytrium salamandrivorans TaxID=1357716 RepID=A0ABQ8F0H4_9FUNG|nr:hypothetical protein BASA61_008795 [Batrachochytrium salamandrivorans]KAH6589951.1 hypothetical protein BASA50_009654 [Batrachochytrium salamandrivorans]KAJ1336482.1 hypothetical protein BSLG_007266 [Batrachochytrium salamandrivorans]
MNPTRKRPLPTLLSEASGTPRRSKRIASKIGSRDLSADSRCGLFGVAHDNDDVDYDEAFGQYTLGCTDQDQELLLRIRRCQALASALPAEVLSLIFHCVAASLVFRPVPATPLPGRTLLLPCALVCRRWSPLALEILHQSVYTSSVIPRIHIPQLVDAVARQTSEWSYICMLAQVCLHRPEWSMGAPRIFYIEASCLEQALLLHESDSSTDTFTSTTTAVTCGFGNSSSDTDSVPLHSVCDGTPLAPLAHNHSSAALSSSNVYNEIDQVKKFALRHPNPADPAWSNIISCSMNVHDTFIELATGLPCNELGNLFCDSDEEGNSVASNSRNSSGDVIQPDSWFHRSAVEDSHQHSMALNSFKANEYFRVTRSPTVGGLDRLLDTSVSAAVADMSAMSPPFHIRGVNSISPGMTAYQATVVAQSSNRITSSPSLGPPSRLIPDQASDASLSTPEAKVVKYSGRLAPHQYHIPMMLRYSERMDIGCFFIFLSLGDNRGSIVLRAKPVGVLSESSPCGNGKLVIWDDRAYGCCSRCQRRLLRVQVCADCRISQFCSRVCQKQDWDSSHRTVCRSLGLHAAAPTSDPHEETHDDTVFA